MENDKPEKIPVELLLVYSRKEVKELKEHIKTLEEEKRILENKLKSSKTAKKIAKAEVRKEELYNELTRQIKSLQEKLHAIRIDKNKLIYELSKYKAKYGNII